MPFVLAYFFFPKYLACVLTIKILTVKPTFTWPQIRVTGFNFSLSYYFPSFKHIHSASKFFNATVHLEINRQFVRYQKIPCPQNVSLNDMKCHKNDTSVTSLG